MRTEALIEIYEKRSMRQLGGGGTASGGNMSVSSMFKKARENETEVEANGVDKKLKQG